MNCTLVKMVAAGVSNFGLDTVGMLLYGRRGIPIVRLGTRGSSRGLGGGVGTTGRGERCYGRVIDEKLKGRVSLVQRWNRRRRDFDSVTFRATAADDVEKKEVVGEQQEEQKAEEDVASSSQRLHELSARESPKVSRIDEQQGRRSRDRRQAGPRNPGLFSNLVEEWVTREKGDVRDVVLMSLSFAIFIYISQHLVHAYCTLRHMYFNHY